MFIVRSRIALNRPNYSSPSSLVLIELYITMTAVLLTNQNVLFLHQCQASYYQPIRLQPMTVYDLSSFFQLLNFYKGGAYKKFLQLPLISATLGPTKRCLKGASLEQRCLRCLTFRHPEHSTGYSTFFLAFLFSIFF